MPPNLTPIVTAQGTNLNVDLGSGSVYNDSGQQLQGQDLATTGASDAVNAYKAAVSSGISNPTVNQYHQFLSGNTYTPNPQNSSPVAGGGSAPAATTTAGNAPGYIAPSPTPPPTAPDTTSLAYYQSLPSTVIKNQANYNNNQPFTNPATNSPQNSQQTTAYPPGYISTPPNNAIVPQASSQTQQNAPGATQTGAIDPQTGKPFTAQQMSALDQMKNSLLQASSQLAAMGAPPNQALADKYNAVFDSLKNSNAPADGSTGRDGVNTALVNQNTNSQLPPSAQFLQAYSALNPVEQGYFNMVNQILSPQSTQTSLVDTYNQLTQSSGLPALQTQLMNIDNVMNGTEDDIRTEIQKAGGFATESQVQALTTARNKTLITQANMLQGQINQKEDYINQVVQLTGADRDEVDKQVTQKLGLAEQFTNLQMQMDNAATQNYQNIVSQVGYSGLAQMTLGNPSAQAAAEQSLGLPKGTLSNISPVNPQQDLQFVSATQYQPAGYFNKTTGTFTPASSSVSGKSSSGSSAGNSASSVSTDPVVQSWVSNVISGNATMQQVPANLRNEVSLSLANAPQDSYSPLAASRLTMAANRIVGNFIKLPQYQLTANGLPYLERINAAMQSPGSVSDQDLLDSLTKLNTSGNAITDAQVRVITDGKSYSDWANTMANKFTTGGVLSNDQRQQIQKIATAIFTNYAKDYQPVYDQAASQLQAAGIPRAFWTIPDLNNLSDYSQYTQPAGGELPGLGGTPVASNPQFGALMMTDFQEVNGVLYAKSADGQYYPL